MKDIKSKLIVKDKSQALIHILPDTDASQVSYNNTTVEDYLDNLSTTITSTVQSVMGNLDALTFKGTLGSGGTVASLPNEHSTGWTYKVATAGTYAGQYCEVGDLVLCIADGSVASDADWTVMQTNIEASKVVGYFSSEPTSGNTIDLSNESLIFYDTGSASTSIAATPVYTSGNQTIAGVKRFVSGIYGNVVTLASNESAFDLSLATCFVKTITENTTLSFTNVPDDVICCITVVLKNGGNYTVTWPNSVKWTSNEVPDLIENGTDVLTFITYTAGNVWYGTTTCVGVTA